MIFLLDKTSKAYNLSVFWREFSIIKRVASAWKPQVILGATCFFVHGSTGIH
jgi:hypothetical protein